MIKEAHCSYEVSKLLKEKGFQAPTSFVWYESTPKSISKENSYRVSMDLFYISETAETPITYNNGEIPEYIDRNVYSAPTHQMAMAWLREKGVYINIFVDDDSEDPWTYNIFARKDGKMTCAYHHHGRYFPLGGYDTALEEALKYCLENLI